MSKQKNEPFYGLAVLVVGIIGFFLCLMCCGPSPETSKEEQTYVYYDVPFYTTVYEIVYPDTVMRHTVVHHSPSRLTSHRGSNFLYSAHHDSENWGDRNRPKYWIDKWNETELNVETTAPIRIISETVEYKKMKYKK